ncbi:hypothetical protein RIF29_37803 [Crotalaria pallida]|uniref:Uncharacterized protein n=1 Tax=Crotalaria pallida TaxID=3830 RepID=A0AAN9DXY0_CROPI
MTASSVPASTVNRITATATISDFVRKRNLYFHLRESHHRHHHDGFLSVPASIVNRITGHHHHSLSLTHFIALGLKSKESSLEEESRFAG